MFIPGIIISFLTFPGIIFHEWGHKFFCDRTGVKVHEVKYFRLGNPAGYVIHEPAKTFRQSFFITIGPFITGTIFSLLFFSLPLFFLNSPIGIFFIWLGYSIGMNCFPSDHDAKSLWSETGRHSKTNLLALVGYPVAAIIWLADKLRVIWFDLIYAIALHAVVMYMFVKILL